MLQVGQIWYNPKALSITREIVAVGPEWVAYRETPGTQIHTVQVSVFKLWELTLTKPLSLSSQKRLDTVLNAIDDLFDTRDITSSVTALMFKEQLFLGLTGAAKAYVRQWIDQQ